MQLAVTAVLVLLLVLALLYILFLRRQMGAVSGQLRKRLAESTRQPVSVELLDDRLNGMVEAINDTIQAEEAIRLDFVRREGEFRTLIAGLSHDLRTPLTAIQGYHQLLADTALDPAQREKLEVARRHTGELRARIDSFFAYSYLLAREDPPELGPVNVVNLLSDCLAGAVPAFEARGMAVEVASPPALHVLADEALLGRVLQNLVANAAAHGAGDLWAEVTMRDGWGLVRMKNPIHADAELDAARVFDRFYTGDADGRGATGLGLTIAKRLVEAQGGEIRVSAHGGMFIVEVQLPLA